MGRICFLFLLCFVGTSSKELKKLLVIESTNVSYMNTDYINVKVVLKKPDRKTNHLSCTLDVFQDLDKLKVDSIILKFAENVYKETGLRYSGELCPVFNLVQLKTDILENEIFEHFITKCPIKRGHYSLNDFSGMNIDASKLPTWKMRLELVFMLRNLKLFEFHMYMAVIDAWI